MEKERQLWLETKKVLKDELDSLSYSENFENIDDVYKVNDNIITIVTTNDVSKFRIIRYWLNRMNEIVSEIAKTKYRFELITSDEASKPAINKILEKDEEINLSRRNIRPEYTFENFITGENNRYAYLSALKAAESPFEVANPLYIFGNVGLGKTHLMMAIANYLLDRNADTNVVYTTAQSFAEDYFIVSSKKNSRAFETFNNHYRNADILLVDDIQLLSGKNATQEEFFKLFEYLYENNKQIVITSDCPSNELENMMARLKSRFAWGLPVDIKSPDLEHRKMILKKKLTFMINNPSEISDEIIEYIAINFVDNIRELEGALRRFVTYYMMMDEKPTLELAKEVLSPLINGKESPITVSTVAKAERIKVIVAKFYQIDPKELSGSSRKKEIAWARQVAMYFIRTQLDMPLQKVGDVFGGRDHTTVMSAETKVKDLLISDWTVKTQIDEICKKIEEK